MAGRIIEAKAQGTVAPPPETPKARASITEPVFDVASAVVRRVQVETTVSGKKRVVIVPSGARRKDVSIAKRRVRKVYQQWAQADHFAELTAAAKWTLMRQTVLIIFALLFTLIQDNLEG